MDLDDVEKQLFFIVGAARSGTTLAQLMISSHPDVMLPDETGFYPILYNRHVNILGELSKPEDFERAVETTLNFHRIKDLDLDSDNIRSKCHTGNLSWETILLAILAAVAEKYSVNRVGEKSPGHLHYIGLLKDRFPNSKFIHIIRDPRAVILSMTKVAFGSQDIKELCNRWQSAMEIHRKYADHLGSKRYMVVKYEDLVLESEKTLHSICEFLNIEFSPQMMEHHKRSFLGFNKRYIAHMSNTLKPVFSSSVEKWKDELNPWQVAVMQDLLSNDMHFMGYELVEVKTTLPSLQYSLNMLMYHSVLTMRRLKRKFFKILKRL